MTTLLDTGYLETDDPVVAACFLEKMVWVEDPDGEQVERCLFTLSRCEVCSDYDYPYPIRIPASTVAEVWGDQPGLRLRHGVILAALDESSHDDDIHETLLHWIDQHTQETT